MYLNHEAIFIYEGPMLGLAIVICTIKNNENFKSIYLTFESVVGRDIYECIKENEKEIYSIVLFLAKI
jgi:hypothetical protein